MKILIIFSGSQGHFQGIKLFLDNLNLSGQIIYASHIGIPEHQLKIIKYFHLNAPPAFLDYEFLHHQDTKKIIQLKSDLVYYKRRKHVLKKLVNEVKPECIILDNHSFTDALVLGELFRKSTIKLLFYQTRLSTALSKGSLYGGHKNNEFTFLSGKFFLKRKKFRRWRKRLTMPGLNEEHRIRKLITLLDFHYVKINRNRRGLNSLTYIPEIVLSGADLSFHTTQNQFYAGLCLPQTLTKSTPSSKKSILVSSGLRSHTYVDYRIFIEAINRIVSHYSSSNFFLPQNLTEKVLGDNITYYSWDTYHDHLAQAHLHITHGGINSIKDSLSYAVPMLICPLDWKSDQIHNALMFEKIGLARTWNVKKYSLEDIRLKIEELLEGDFKERIEEYVEEDRRRYPVEKVREEFEELIRDERFEIRNW